ncbi:MAG: hypothetical protein Q3983_04610 [Capnocytophaga sp.]|nr:hypothetical protein [Capnocytophaga sp.]
MNFWHIQLHPSQAENWTEENTRKIIETGYIGCSGKPVKIFYQLQIGDVVLVRYGAKIVGLVEVITLPEKKEEENETLWFSDSCKIKILAFYENIKIGGKGWYLPTTLQRIDKENQIAFSFIEKLYHEVK